MYRFFLALTFFVTAICCIIISSKVILARQKSDTVIKKNISSVVVNSKQVQISSTPTQKPTSIPTPTLTPTPTQVPPTPTQTKVTEDTFKDVIMRQINDYRVGKGLSQVTTSAETCAFAKTRVLEIAQTFNHDGFRKRIDEKTLPYPSYTSVTENIAMNRDYTKVVQQWILSAGHAANMEKDTPFVCVEKSGNYYVYEGWRP